MSVVILRAMVMVVSVLMVAVGSPGRGRRGRSHGGELVEANRLRGGEFSIQISAFSLATVKKHR